MFVFINPKRAAATVLVFGAIVIVAWVGVILALFDNFQ